MNSPFLRKNSKDLNVGLPIRILSNCTSLQSGDVGLEVEVEGNFFRKNNQSLPTNWKYVHDGSLRGDDNAEYVFSKALPFSEVSGMVQSLWSMFKDDDTVLEDSHRTSLHVHLNVQNFYLDRLCSFLALYFIVEELLSHWCGEHRVGNLFCLRAKDAPAIVTQLKKYFQANGSLRFDDNFHYAGLNAQAIDKFGSVEVRLMRGPRTPEDVTNWVGILEHLYNLSASFEDPRDVVQGFSGGGPLNFLKRILGEHYEMVVQGSGLDYSDISQTLYTGVRFAQDLCFCRDWDELEKADLSSDPFGRTSEVSEKVESIINMNFTDLETMVLSYQDYQDLYTSTTSAPITTGLNFSPPLNTHVAEDVSEFEDMF